MKVKDLLALLAQKDPEAVVLIPGFETMGGVTVIAAEADQVEDMQSVPLLPSDPLMGNRQVVASGGEPSVWIGWQDDYRTATFMEDVRHPDDPA